MRLIVRNLCLCSLLIALVGVLAAAPAADRANAAQATLSATATAAAPTMTATLLSTVTGIPSPIVINTPYLGVRATSGEAIRVVEVVPGSPAALAGFLVGDVITSIRGTPIPPNTSLASALGPYVPGTDLTLVVTRADGPHTLRVVLGERPSPVPPVSGGFLGVGLEDSDTGVRVVRIEPNSPAETVGLRVDDVITQVDEQKITLFAQVQALLSGKAPGQIVIVTVQRAGRSLTFNAALSGRPAPAVPTLPVPPTLISPANPRSDQPDTQPYAPGAPRVRLGVAYEVVTPALADARKLSVQSGALIVEVQPNSPAEAAGLKIGDVVTEVDGDKVDAKHTLAVRMVAYGAGDTLTLTVVRGTETLKVPVTLAARGVA